MRIVCQKCSAAYAIDDKFVTAKGVRAQCPRCRHMQLVKKDEAGAAPAPAQAAAPPPAAPKPAGGELHFGQTSPAPQGGQGGSPFNFDFVPPFPGGGAAPEPPAPAGSPFDFAAVAPGASNPFDFGSPPPGSEAAAAPATAPSPFDFGAPAQAPAPSSMNFGSPPPPAPAAASPFDFGAPAPGPGPAAAAPSPFDFGSPAPAAAPPSPFDFGAPAPGPAVAPPAASPSRAPVLRAPAPAAGPANLDSLFGLPGGGSSEVSGVKCRSCGKEITDAFDQALGVCDDCRSKVSGGSESPSTESAPSAAQSAPRPPPPSFPSAGTAMGPGDVSQVRSALRTGAGGKGKVVGLAVGVVVLVAVGVGLLIKRPWATKAPPLVTQQGGPARPVDAIIQQWRLKYPDISESNARQLVDEGEELLAKDTTKSYLDAEEAFQQALVLEPSNDRALAGWVLSLAFGRAGQIDEASAKAAESMMGIAEQRGGELRVFVAHAHFLIARGGPANDVKVLAERALNSKNPNDRALASLAVGQTLLTKNPELADRSFKDALSIDPKLKRSYFFLAQLAVTQGRYKDASDALEKRLQLDADQWEAAEELARLSVDVGEVGRAKKVLEDAKAAAPRSGRPRLGLAMLAYQHQGDSAGATEQLNALINDPESTRADRADALVHLATIQRMQGDVVKAGESLEAALELQPDSVPAKLQHFLVYLERNVTSSARMELDGIKGKLGDKYLEAVLEGRLQLAESRLDDAMKTLSAVAEADPRRVDALLLGGAVAAKARKDGKAWEFCLKKGLRADPGSRAVPSMTHLFVRPADLLRPAAGAYSALVAELEDDPNPSICEGLVAWYSEDLAVADKMFTRVTNIDPKSADGYAFRSLIALRRKDLGGALKLANRAVESSRTNPLGYYALALAQQAANKPDLAKVAASNALKFGPQLLGPRVVMGDVDAGRKDVAEARRNLTSVLLSDSLYRDAKRVLFKHAL